MAAQTVTIGSAVGRMPALNALKDQNAIIGLLNIIRKGRGLQPIQASQRAGIASPELIAAIVDFQSANVEQRFRDGRVDPGGTTLAKLNAAAADPASGLETGIAWLEDRYEEETRTHIVRAIRAYPGYNETETLKLAVDKLCEERNEIVEGKLVNCSNRPLAYAEHYLVARWIVAHGSINALGGRQALFALMTGGVLAYDTLKLINYIQSLVAFWETKWPEAVHYRRYLLKWALQLGKCPMSDHAPDLRSIKWGLKGATDGMTPLRGDPIF